MAYRIDVPERLARELRQIATRELQSAIESLRDQKEGRDVAIHRCRKSLKKVRALLRLVRKEIGDDIYRAENTRLRDIAASMSAMRDSDVLIGTLVSLRQWADARLAPDELVALSSAIQKSREFDAGTTPDDAITKAIDNLELAVDRAARWPIERNRFLVIEGGIKRSYRSGRRGYARILEDPIEENLHEWRKQVKYLWYMCRLLSRALERSHKNLVEDLDSLAGLLGKDRDLELLRARALQMAPEAGSPTVIRLIDERRAELQEAAKSLGSRLYNRKPKAFVKRVREDWEEFRAKG